MNGGPFTEVVTDVGGEVVDGGRLMPVMGGADISSTPALDRSGKTRPARFTPQRTKRRANPKRDRAPTCHASRSSPGSHLLRSEHRSH